MTRDPLVVRLHTRVWNPQAPRRALLLHGLGSDGSTMWRLADHLARHGLAVTAPDLRGAGVSPAAASYALEELAADVRLLGSGWDLVVGHSLGGAIAAVLLADDGFAAAGVLLDPVIVVEEADKPALEAELLREVGGALTLESVLADHPAWDLEDVYRMVHASALVTPRVVHRVLADTTPWDLVAHAASWPAAVTVLAADPRVGALFTTEHADRLRDIAANVRVVTVPDAGHSVHRDAPAIVLTALDEAVRETSAGGAAER